MNDKPSSYTPLYDPEEDSPAYDLPLDQILRRAREVLQEKATANIHNPNEMIRAAVGLEMRLRQLVTALDKEAGR